MSYQEGIRAAGVTRTLPSVRTITPRDLIEVLSKGLDDFRAMPSHAIFLGLFYPIAGLVIALVGIQIRPCAAALPDGGRFWAGRPFCGDRHL